MCKSSDGVHEFHRSLLAAQEILSLASAAQQQVQNASEIFPQLPSAQSSHAQVALSHSYSLTTCWARRLYSSNLFKQKGTTVNHPTPFLPQLKSCCAGAESDWPALASMTRVAWGESSSHFFASNLPPDSSQSLATSALSQTMRSSRPSLMDGHSSSMCAR